MNPMKRLSMILDPGDGMIPESEYPDDMGRNSTYTTSGSFRQFLSVYLTQLKLYSKEITTMALFLFVLVIPVLTFSGILDGFVFDRYLQEIGDTGETYAALCLGLLSLMMALVASMVCGNILPNEFRSRTAYLNLPFPQTRAVFYFGKFLAGLTVVFSIVLAAFAMVIFASSWRYDSLSSAAMMQALYVSLAGTFAFCATAFGISAFMNRSSTMLPFVFIFMVLPMIGLLFSETESVSQYVGYLPCFSGDVAVSCLGSTYSVSTSYLFSDTSLILGCSPAVSAAVSLLWGIVFMIIGYHRICRREL